MGLDMYLTRKKYVGANYEHRNIKGIIDIKMGDKQIPVDFKKVTYIEEESCYWRKANAIHKWFVDKVQGGIDDCKPYYVELSDLEDLLSLCKEVKEKAIIKSGKIKNGETLKNGEWEPIMEDGEYIENADEIAKILPTTSGCFFGSVDYDQWYMQDIEYTIKKLEEIIKKEKEENEKGIYSDYYYQSSW